MSELDPITIGATTRRHESSPPSQPQYCLLATCACRATQAQINDWSPRQLGILAAGQLGCRQG